MTFTKIFAENNLYPRNSRYFGKKFIFQVALLVHYSCFPSAPEAIWWYPSSRCWWGPQSHCSHFPRCCQPWLLQAWGWLPSPGIPSTACWVFTLHFAFLFGILWDRVSAFSFDWSWTHCVALAGLELSVSLLSASWGLGLKVCVCLATFCFGKRLAWSPWGRNKFQIWVLQFLRFPITLDLSSPAELFGLHKN